MPEPGFRIAAEKEIVSSCQRIIAPTLRERDNLIRLYGASAEKIGVVPCGVNLEIFFPDTKAASRNKLGLNPADTIVLYVGRFDPLKGLNSLLKAMTFFKGNHRIRLAIVGGDGDKTPEYQKLVRDIRKLGIEKKVILAGRVDQHNLPPYYNAADVLVMPSHYESFGMVALEALACGRPVVATPVGAVDSLIRAAQAGYIVSDPSPRSLADGIQSIISDRRIPSADEIRKSVLEFSWPNVTSAIIAEYEDVIRQQLIEEDQRVPAKASASF